MYTHIHMYAHTYEQSEIALVKQWNALGLQHQSLKKTENNLVPDILWGQEVGNMIWLS